MKKKHLLPPKPGAGNSSELVALYQKGDFAAFERKARALLSREPGNGKCLHLLGLRYLQQGNNAPALELLLRAKAALPGDPQVGDHLAIALARQGRLEEALSIYREATTRAGASAVRLTNMGVILRTLGKLEEAEQCYQQAVALDPCSAVTQVNLANTLRDNGRYAEAVSAYKKALAIDPRNIGAYLNLGTLLKRTERFSEAEDWLTQALAVEPANADVLNNLASVQTAQGRLAAAAATYRRALELSPGSALMHSNLLFCLTHQENIAPEALSRAHLEYGAKLERQIIPLPHAARDNPGPGRPLKVGFVSGDLCNHPVAIFLESVLRELARGDVEIYAYSNCEQEDEVSARLRNYARNWHATSRLSDEAMAQQVFAHKIDILVDLAGHTGGNRLPVFARKPAPVQCSWIGYPNTTGLRAMDYVICDRYNSPPGLFEHLWVEKFARLPSASTVEPPGSAPLVNDLPALRTGLVTFGSFNRASKIGEEVIATWALILREVANSRLLLGNISDSSTEAQIMAKFSRLGVVPERLTFRPYLPMAQYLALYNEIDILLDTWPYTGGTTTNHTLWMGVPVVTLQGPSRAHCASAGTLGRLGLSEWVARNTSQFVSLAVQWANNLAALAEVRRGLRSRCEVSPLRRPATVARGLEKAFRVMWQRRCAGLPPEHFEVELPELTAPVK